jgi:hypothetical protein
MAYQKMQSQNIANKTVIIHEKKFHWGKLFGARIFGLGRASAGDCAGPLFAQIGSGFLTIVVTLLSAVCGT